MFRKKLSPKSPQNYWQFVSTYLEKKMLALFCPPPIILTVILDAIFILPQLTVDYFNNDYVDNKDFPFAVFLNIFNFLNTVSFVPSHYGCWILRI